jgi:hypothetical protein
MQRLVIALAGLVAGCASKAPSIFDLEIPPDELAKAQAREKEPAPLMSATQRPRSPDGKCMELLTVGALGESNGSCFVDARVRGVRGVLVYACDGGDAEADFGKAKFHGTFHDGALDISLETSFDFSDGCKWVSHQRISGTMRNKVTYTYGEAPKPGQHNCASACTATANVEAVTPKAD